MKGDFTELTVEAAYFRQTHWFAADAMEVEFSRISNMSFVEI